MVSTDKLIKVGVKYTDKYFEDLKRIYTRAYNNNESLEKFLNETNDYSIGNPLEANDFKENLTNIIASSTNDIRFSRPAQKALMNTIIKQTTGELIVDVGNEVKQSVKDIVAKGYNTRTLSRKNVADEITSTLDGINKKRARVIARTEIKRAQTTSNYMVAKERGANAYKYKCGAEPCDICKKDCGETFPIDDLSHLPPRHPNCMCSVTFFKDPNMPDAKPGSVEEPTAAQLKKNLTPAEREKYDNYKRNIPRQMKWLRENPNASAEEIAKHKKRLAFLQQKFEELRVKALGGGSGGVSTPKAAPKPKATAKPKPKETPKPKPKPKEKPKAKPKEKPKETQTPTQDQLTKNLTKKELKEYNDILKIIKWAKDVQNSEYVSAKGKESALKKLNELTPRFNELTQKALTGKSTKTPKSKSTSKKTKTKKEPKLEITVDKPKNARLTKEEADSMTFEQLAEHHGAKYKGLVKIAEDNNKEYHVFEQTLENGETFKLHFEKSAVNSYKKEKIATANEIIHEVFKVPVSLRKETNEIWFRNSQKSLAPNKKRTGFKSFAGDEGGHNISTDRRYYKLMTEMGEKLLNDPNHRIAINPKYFKKLKDFYDIINWRDRPEEKVSWKHAIHHEFTHSSDISREIWQKDLTRLSDTEEYKKIHEKEKYFTAYANSIRSESFAEHGGFISYMLANPNDQSKLLKIQVPKQDENGRTRVVEEQINFEQYKERYPLHYEYFVKLFKGEI